MPGRVKRSKRNSSNNKYKSNRKVSRGRKRDVKRRTKRSVRRGRKHNVKRGTKRRVRGRTKRNVRQRTFMGGGSSTSSLSANNSVTSSESDWSNEDDMRAQYNQWQIEAWRRAPRPVPAAALPITRAYPVERVLSGEIIAEEQNCLTNLSNCRNDLDKNQLKVESCQENLRKARAQLVQLLEEFEKKEEEVKKLREDLEKRSVLRKRVHSSRLGVDSRLRRRPWK